jgi:hypothetical protein
MRPERVRGYAEVIPETDRYFRLAKSNSPVWLFDAVFLQSIYNHLHHP